MKDVGSVGIVTSLSKSEKFQATISVADLNDTLWNMASARYQNLKTENFQVATILVADLNVTLWNMVSSRYQI